MRLANVVNQSFTRYRDTTQTSRWREIRACNDKACGESKGQNFHESLLDPTFLVVATTPKAPIY